MTGSRELPGLIPLAVDALFAGAAAGTCACQCGTQRVYLRALARHDPAFSSMRCLGCAAKTSHQVLQAAMREAVSLAIHKGADLNLMPPSGLETDCASLPAQSGISGWVQSVDILSEIVSDPFLLGEIATVHALSDIYASLSKPLYSLAIINLPETELSIQTNQLTHILAGALLAHSQAGVRVVGGHTSEGGGLSVGFAVTGSTTKLPAEIMRDEDEDFRFVLTKSLGKVAFERLRDDMTGYLAVKHPGNNIHVKSIAVLHALHVGNVQYRQ